MRKTFLLFSFLLSSSVYPSSCVQDLNTLYQKFDHDKDLKITIDDKLPEDVRFKTKVQPEIEVKGVYFLSNLAQELVLCVRRHSAISESKVFQNPVEKISTAIRERYWDGLTRKIDKTTLTKVVVDPKVQQGKHFLYLPENDEEAFRYYEKAGIKEVRIKKLPKVLKAGFIRDLGKEQGLLSLALKREQGVPYVVPGGRFNEMYGWDSYFHVLGTLSDGRVDLAEGMVENFIYEIEHYGKILNANRTYYLSRSQPPFFTSMIRALLEHKSEKEWLQRSVRAAIREYDEVWMGKERLTQIGLSRYGGIDEGIPPEVEPGHFDEILKPFAKKHKLSLAGLKKRYSAGKLLDPELTEFFHQDRAVRESGHDTTYRWRVGDKDRALDFVTVDLNSLLYKYELDLGYILKNYFQGALNKRTAEEFYRAAEKRKELIRKFLWNPNKGMFTDYDFIRKQQSEFLAAVTFYPLWASTGHEKKYDILNGDEALKLIQTALPLLEEAGGLSASAHASWERIKKDSERQWDYPYGWAPHQIMAWEGFKHYGYNTEAERLIYKWLYTITKNARDYSGIIPEKFNLVTMSHKVFAEYGNVGTKFSYITTEGFGWMNASYQLGLKLLSPAAVERLKKLEKP